jgi:hypothetical protein
MTVPKHLAQIFFGLWLTPMGYLAYKSGWFPKALGIALGVVCVSYLVDLLVKGMKSPAQGAPPCEQGKHAAFWERNYRNVHAFGSSGPVRRFLARVTAIHSSNRLTTAL